MNIYRYSSEEICFIKTHYPFRGGESDASKFKAFSAKFHQVFPGQKSDNSLKQKIRKLLFDDFEEKKFCENLALDSQKKRKCSLDNNAMSKKIKITKPTFSNQIENYPKFKTLLEVCEKQYTELKLTEMSEQKSDSRA